MFLQSKTAWAIFTRFHMGPSVEKTLAINLNRFASLNKMAVMLIYDKKHFKNLLLQNQEMFEADSWYIASRAQSLPSLFKWWPYVDLYRQGQICSPFADLGGSVGCAVRSETRRSRVQPPLRSATFFRGEWSWNIFNGHSLPSADSRKAIVSFQRKNVHNTG